MARAEDHNVIKTLAPNRTDHALDVRVLPRRSWCGSEGSKDRFREQVISFSSPIKISRSRFQIQPLSTDTSTAPAWRPNWRTAP
jgi:hypothetical protein